MNQTITLALDAMGGDHGPRVVIPAAILALKRFPTLSLVLVGDQKILKSKLRHCPKDLLSRLTIHHASEVVTMDELPTYALKNKKDSSMRVAINLVKDQTVAACVSAGNTGALMATSRFVLKMLPGIDRPAIMSIMPSMKGSVRMLDLGANVDCAPEHLLQFAVMGSILVQSVEGIAQPTVGLLNNGREAIKGNELVKAAALLLENQANLNYIGYIEGDDIYKGTANLVVCDGFVGNITLKASEGLAKLIQYSAKQAIKENWLTKLGALLAYPLLKKLKKNFDPAHYNGASFLGLKGIVVKSHGGANVIGFYNAIVQAIKEVQHDVPKQIEERISSWLMR